MGYQLDNNYWKTLVQIVAKGKLCLLFLCIILKAFSHFAHVPCFNSSKTAPTYQLAKAVFMSPLRFVTEYIHKYMYIGYSLSVSYPFCRLLSEGNC